MVYALIYHKKGFNNKYHLDYSMLHLGLLTGPSFFVKKEEPIFQIAYSTKFKKGLFKISIFLKK